VGVRGMLVTMEGGVSYERDERCFSEGDGVASGVGCEGLWWDGAGWGGMIASLSSGGGGLRRDRRLGLRTEMIQLVVSMSEYVHSKNFSPRSPHDGRELGWPHDAGPLRASVPGCCHNAAM
jgi:hypothetical protein